jgi:hypothetical protein
MNRWMTMGLVATCVCTGCTTDEAEYVFLRSSNSGDLMQLFVPETGEAALGAVELESFDLATVEYALSPRHRGYLLEGDVDVGDESGRSFALQPFEDRIGHVNVERSGPWRSVRVYDVGVCSHVLPWEKIAAKWVERLALRIVTSAEFTNGRRDGIGVIAPSLAVDRSADPIETLDSIAIEVPIAADRYVVDPSGAALGCDDLRATLVARIAPVSNGIDVTDVDARVDGAASCTTEQTRAIVRELEASLVQFAGSEIYRLVVEDASRAAGDCTPVSCTTVPVSVTRFHVRPEGIEAVVAEDTQHGLPPSAHEICDPLRMPEANPDVPFPIYVP